MKEHGGEHVPPVRAMPGQRDILPLPLVEADGDDHVWSDDAAGVLPETERRRRPVSRLVSFGMVALLVIGAALTWGVVTLHGTGSRPGDAIEALYTALLESDCRAVEAHTTPLFRGDNGFPDCENREAWEDISQGITDVSVQVLATDIDPEGLATVRASITLTMGDSAVGPADAQFSVMKRDGHWLVDGLTTSDVGAIDD